MSYILEALRKSEKQREIGQIPGIGSVHENTPKSVSGNWLWVIVAVLLLNAGLLVFLLWPESEPEPEPAAMSAPFREPVPVRRGSASVAPIVSRPPVLEGPVPRVPQAAGIGPVSEPPAPEPVKAEPAPKPVVQEPVRAALTPAQPPLVQPPRPLVKAEPPALPVWPQIPSHLFQQVSGSLRLDVHVFSDQPQQRFVLINMQKYKEGEKLQEGPQLDEITPEGVILSFHGQRFRVQAQ